MSTEPPAALQPPKLDRFHLGVDYAGPLIFLLTFLMSMPFVKGQDRILWATWGLVAGSAGALLVCLMVRRRIAPLPAFFGGAALLFGIVALVFHDPTIVKMKTTFIDGALGVTMLWGLALGRSPIKLLMGQGLHLSDLAWRRLTFRFGLFFLAMALANEGVWRTQPDVVWVFFRWPGLIILTVVFTALQAPLILREYAKPDGVKTDGRA
jgi:intracellular septation protein